MLELTTYASLTDVPKNVRDAFPTLHWDTQRCQFLLAHRNGEALGIAKLFVGENNINLEMLSVLPDHQHHGVAIALLETIYQQAAATGIAVTTNGFTADGKKYLQHVMDKLGANYHVPTEVIGIC